MLIKGDGGGSEMDWEFGVGRCKLLHLEWISNEVHCIAQESMSSLLGWTMMEDNTRKGMCVCVCVCVCVYIYICICIYIYFNKKMFLKTIFGVEECVKTRRGEIIPILP